MGFWDEKKVLVTGGAGFVGRHVVRLLKEQGCIPFVPRSISYDLRLPRAIGRLLRDAKPDIIIHLAAHAGGIGLNRARPAELFLDNAIMGIQLLNQAWEAGIEKFVVIGTVCSYPKFCPAPFVEENFWEGYPEETNAPYGLAKKMLLVQAQAYRQQYGFNAIYLVPVNLYGPGDNFDLETGHVIPALIRKFLEAKAQGKQAIEAWGTGTASREFLYVEDAAEAIVLAAEHYDGAEPINLGTGSEIRIAGLAEVIARLCDFQGDIVWDATKPDGQPRRSLNTCKASRYFGWEAKTPLEEGLRRTIEWYIQNIRYTLCSKPMTWSSGEGK